MSDLLSRVIPLSIGAAISPAVLAVIVVVLGGRRAVARGAVFTAGVLTVLVGLTVSGLLISHQSHPSPERVRITHDVSGLLGVLLLCLAIITILRSRTHSDTGAPVHTSDPAADRGLVAMYVLGFGLMISNLSSIVLYLPAMHAISDAGVSGEDRVLAVAIALLITSVPATVPLLLRIALPRRSGPIFATVNRFVTSHSRAITVTVEVGFGVYLVVRAFR
ncbi:MAG: GAP family protein [Acidobacteria bacterium]|nr:GAP family protein [Acidobacteriota bacterium]